MKVFIISCLLSLLFLPPCTAQARTWIIHAEGIGDAPTIQAGIDSAAVGDTVLLECGTTYHEHDINMKSGVYLVSLGEQADCAVINADGLGRCISAVDLATPATIKGLTLREGKGLSVPGYGYSLVAGGGIFISHSSLTITDCAFTGNHSDGAGGGIYSEYYSSITLVNCSFTSNSADGKGGGMACDGATLMGCTFSENSAGSGGAIASGTSLLTLTQCLFVRNVALENGFGGAIIGGVMDATNCTFVSNQGYLQDAIWGGDIQLTNTILAFNSIGGTAYECAVSASCCDFYQSWIHGNCLYPGSPDSFSLDPQFCDAANGNYSLKQCSPCAPGNHPGGNDCGLIGAFPVGCVATAVTPTTWGKIKTLFR